MVPNNATLEDGLGIGVGLPAAWPDGKCHDDAKMAASATDLKAWNILGSCMDFEVSLLSVQN
ncbi:MAG: hypothetical protein OEX17_05650 [Rhodospirillaceae bacterium]|nr:hypothetical protein [Rhodospirillaceae bacterium]